MWAGKGKSRVKHGVQVETQSPDLLTAINPLFILQFKPILDRCPYGSVTDGKTGPVEYEQKLREGVIK
jgi:hypothetical protein